MRRIRLDHPDGSYQYRLQVAGLTADPTANDVEFQLIPVGDTRDTATLATWTAGTWGVAYDSARRTAWADTPLIGSAATLPVEAGKSYRLLMRLNFGASHTPIYDAALIEVAGSTAKIGR